MNRIAALRFFLVVSLHSRLMLVALVAVGAVAAIGLLLDPMVRERAATPVVFAQMLAASTGFAVRARRGHLDLLLTGGQPRVEAAVAHLAMSIAPGVAVWLAVGAVEAAGHIGSPSATLAGGSAAAMLLVSALAWAATVPFPPLSGGIAWILVTVTATAVAPAWLDLTGGSGGAPFSSGALYVVCPFVLVGRPVLPAELPAVLGALALAAAAVAAALAWITRADVALEASQ
jgi:hypothetical protein